MHGFRARCFASPRNDESFPFVSHNGRIIFSRFPVIPGQRAAPSLESTGLHVVVAAMDCFAASAMTMSTQWARQINTTGKSPKSLSIPSRKNIPLTPSGKSVI